MRVKCAVPPLCYDFSNVAKYLAIPSVQSALGVTGHKWADCNHAVAVGFELGGDWMHDFETMIPDQLVSSKINLPCSCRSTLFYASHRVPPGCSIPSQQCPAKPHTHTQDVLVLIDLQYSLVLPPLLMI